MDLKNLSKIGKEMLSQDNHITQDPLFCVFEKERIYGLIPGYSDEFEWMNSDGESVEEDLDENLQKVYFIERDRFVNAHFTRKAASEYIGKNRHNLNRPFIYVISLNKCDEMIYIRRFLMSLGGNTL